MINSFTGANVEFANLGIHFFLAEVVKFRQQLQMREEAKSQSGWNDPLNDYLMEELERLAVTLASITNNKENKTEEQLEAEAADVTRPLSADYNNLSLHSDNILMPSGRARPVRWQLDGSHPDLQQVNIDNCPNDFFRTFILGLDHLFVEMTRLDSRHQPRTITKYESAMMRALLDELYTITQRKGGEANKSDIASGTLPSQEPKTFNADHSLTDNSQQN